MAGAPGPAPHGDTMNDSGILREGHNCWRIAPAHRVAFLIDGKAYFDAFREAAKRARRSLLIIGWDVDSRFEITREPVDDGLPTRLGEFLEALVERREGLEIHVLDWDFAMIYAPDREWLPVYKMDWTTNRRLHFRLDSHHPVGASHHQKIVVVDDGLAFVGGLDFALGRWDTSEHLPDDPRREEKSQTHTQPYHDLQMMVEGEAAAALGDLARERWLCATGETVEPPSLGAGVASPWPPGLDADLEQVHVGIARTYPAYDDQAEVREVERLALDAIAAARRNIYIENQYFTAQAVGEAIGRRLAEPDGPEVLLLLPERTDGWLAQNTMDVLRERLLRRLFENDAHARFKVYWPVRPGLDDLCINVHAKLLIVDDELLRVGSSNLANRSLGLDSECDLVIESRGNRRVRAGLAGLRRRLLAEHLDVTPDEVAEAEAREGSVLRAVESLRGGERTLHPFEFRVSEERDALVPEARISDPEMPVDASRVAQQFVHEEEREPAKRTFLTLLGILAVALLLAAAWRYTPLSQWADLDAATLWFSELRRDWTVPLIVVGVYIVAGLLVFPITLLIVATGAAFGAWLGFAYALLGAEISALATYAIGHFAGYDTVRRISSRWATRVDRRLARQGLLAVIALRIIPVAPFSVINLVAGASRIRLRDFALGTLIGMTPGTLALTLFSDQVVAAITSPEATRFVVLAALAIAIGVGTWWLARWVLRRR
jgi:phosphatidylserine/phosphatidylglycerophosphate/cardiolipin synthase-like enzyme/uncharacterized membrane protein YdjX (TVP38/TMEM64 family)